MTKKQLLKELEDFDDNAEVHFAFPSHDHCGRTLAGSVDDVRQGVISWSEYHQENKVLEENDYQLETVDEIVDDDEREGVKEIILLS